MHLQMAWKTSKEENAYLPNLCPFKLSRLRVAADRDFRGFLCRPNFVTVVGKQIIVYNESLHTTH